MAAATLPEYVVLQSKYNNKYLQFVHQEGDLHGFLQFSGDDVVSPYTKFQVQVSGTDQTLVHLRSCYNNKYWVPSTELENWVLAAANEPEEDQTKLACTLFEPTYMGGDSKAVRFMHVNIKKYAALMNNPGTHTDACMYLSSESPNQDLHDVCTIIDWSSLVIFPQNIAIKGGMEGKYLCARPVIGTNYLQFVADDLADPTVGQEVFTSGAGNISVRSDYYGKFWTRTTSSYVLADTTDNDITNRNILFSPSTIGGKENVFAFKSLGNNDYCKSIDIFTPAGEIIALSAADATITTLSHLEVINRATSLSVNIAYSDIRAADVRVTVPTPIVLGAAEVVNNTEKNMIVVVTLSYIADSLTRTWSSTVNGSLKTGFNVDISSPVPDEVNGKIEITGSTAGNFPWGIGEAKADALIDATYEMMVPPMTKATVQAMAQKRLWDVPFSYTQNITLADGTEKSSEMDDGIYTGTRTLFHEYNVDFVPIA